MAFFQLLKDLVKKPKKPIIGTNDKDKNRYNRPPTTIREVYLPSQESEESWCELSDALVRGFEGKIMKYFDIQENLSGFCLRSETLGLELRKVENNFAGGYVLVGNEGYRDRFIEIKKVYDDSYKNLKITKEFDNRLNRAGFCWKGRMN